MKILDREIALGRAAPALVVEELRLLPIEEVFDPGNVDIVVLLDLDAHPNDLLETQIGECFLI